MQPFREHIERAIQLKGSQEKLAEAAGCSQQQISYLLKDAKTITPEMAVAIDRATDGEVSKFTLRPDLAALFAPATSHEKVA